MGAGHLYFSIKQSQAAVRGWPDSRAKLGNFNFQNSKGIRGRADESSLTPTAPMLERYLQSSLMATRFFFLILLVLSFESLFSQSHSDFDTHKLTKKIESEFLELFKKYLEVSVDNRDSALSLNDKMITKMLELYSIDSTHPAPGQYLTDFYSIKGNSKEVIRWSNHALKYSSYYKPNIDRYNIIKGYAYINLRQFDSAKIYFQIALDQLKFRKDTLGIREFIKSIFVEADNLYLRKENICEYYLTICKFILPDTKIYMDEYFIKQITEKWEYRSKDCR